MTEMKQEGCKDLELEGDKEGGGLTGLSLL